MAHLVVNPAANRGRAVLPWGEIRAYLEGCGIWTEWHVTEEPGHARRIVSGLPDGTLVIAAGGDGTVHEVATACVGSERIIGILPVGSGNDYIKALGIGTNLGWALEAIVRGKVQVVDVGEVNGILFNNGLGIGFDAEVAERVARAPKALGGFGGYLWSVARLLLGGFECHEAYLKLGSGEEIPTKTILVAVALGTTYGGGFKLAPYSRLDDGAFDVVWSEEVTRAEVLRLIPAVLRGSHLAHPKIHFARTAGVEVSLAKPVPAHVDGEMLAPTRSFRARVLSRALRVMVP